MTTYRKQTRVHTGGQGEVWKGTRVEDGVVVAMKYLILNPASASQDARRFERELRLQSTLVHPHITPIFGRNLKESPPWYAMPWTDTNLRNLILPGGMDETAAISMIDKILAALEYAHEEGVLHRDLKPENVLIFDGQPKLADFGLSRLVDQDSTTLTITGIGGGTLAYSAPEQLRALHSADARSDIYSVGKILLEMLTGEHPFPTFDVNTAPARFRYVIGKCLEGNPARRYQKVSELRRELQLLLSPPASLLPARDQADALVAQILAGDVSAIHQLDELLAMNSDDELLYQQLVPYLPRPVIDAYLVECAPGLTRLEQCSEPVDRPGGAYLPGDLVSHRARPASEALVGKARPC